MRIRSPTTVRLMAGEDGGHLDTRSITSSPELRACSSTEPTSLTEKEVEVVDLGPSQPLVTDKFPSLFATLQFLRGKLESRETFSLLLDLVSREVLRPGKADTVAQRSDTAADPAQEVTHFRSPGRMLTLVTVTRRSDATRSSQQYLAKTYSDIGATRTLG
jgi:hypothetical protein